MHVSNDVPAETFLQTSTTGKGMEVMFTCPTWTPPKMGNVFDML